MENTSLKKYSLIIIGGGITGLSTAITYAQKRSTSENPVLLLEKQPIVGGMVTSFKRKGFLFDTSQLVPDPKELFEYFGIDLNLKRFKNYFARIFLVNNGTATEICIPSGFDDFKNMLLQRYPDQSDSIENFFSYSKSMFDELVYLKVEPSVFDLIKTLLRCPKTVKSSKKTFHEYFQSFGFTNPELVEIFDVFAAFSGLPAERASSILTVGAMITSLNGVYRPMKGFIQLPLALRKRAEELGCEVRTKSQVVKIITEDGKVSGVQLENGEKICGETIVTTIDPKVALIQLVGIDTVKSLNPKYARKAEEVKMSASSITVSLGLDDAIDLESLGMDCGYNVITTGRGTFEELFNAFDKGEYIIDPACFHTAVICPSLTTGGKPVIIIRGVPFTMGNWKALRESDYEAYSKQKEKVADFYIEQVEKYLIPNLRNHIVIKDIASPATFERYSGSPTGSNYDMAPYVDNFGLKRLKMRTPVQGLFQPKFSHGIWASMQAGLQVVDMILQGEIMNGYSRYRKR